MDLDKEIELYSKKLTNALSLIRNKKYEEAKKTLEEYINYARPMSEETDDNRFFSFRDEIEFYAAKRILNIGKTMTWTKFQMSYAYNLLSFIANEEKDYKKAIEYSKEALLYNPLDSNLYFEQSETFKAIKDIDSMYAITRSSYEILFDAVELARYYRNLGYYYVEKQNYPLAYSLYALSLNYNATDSSFKEIEKIKSECSSLPKTNESILALIKEAGIEIGIKQKNKEILIDFIKELPDQVDNLPLRNQAKSMLKKTGTDVFDINYLVDLKNPPKISIDDMFDPEKIVLDSDDEKRKQKNIQIMVEKKYPYLDNFKAVPTSKTTSLKNIDDIMSRMLKEYTFSTLAVYALENQNALITPALKQLEITLGVNEHLDIKDYNFINLMVNGSVNIRTLESLTWMIESVNIYMWTLSLVDEIDSTKECDIVALDKFFLSIRDKNEIKNKAKLRSKEEILEKLDLITRYHYAVTTASLKGEKIELNSYVLREQKLALEWVLDFKIENIMKSMIDIKYAKGDFDFSFTIPSFLHIKELINIKKPRNMLSIVNNDETKVLTLVNYGKIDESNFEAKALKDQEDYISFGWTKCYVDDLETNFKRVVFNVTLEGKDKSEFGIVKYYFILCGNLVTLESLLSKDTNYSDLNSVINDENNTVAYDMIKSIKENTSKKD